VTQNLERVSIESVPFPFTWHEPPARTPSLGRSSVEIAAGPSTDLFVDPAGRPPALNAPRLLGRATGDFQLAAVVRVEFEATFDAGAIVVWVDDGTWAKLALERSPDGEPTIVTVVTRGRSDDCNSFVVVGCSSRLRASRLGSAFAFHVFAGDGSWTLVRHFTLPGSERSEIGFLAQSPLGDGCVAAFDDVRYRPEGHAQLRDGG